MANIKFKLNKDAMTKIKEFVGADVEIKIGILNDAQRPDGFGAVELASVHEFGSVKMNIPKRSFLLKTYANRIDEFSKVMADNSDKMEKTILSGQTDKFLNKIGMQWVAYVLETFESQGPGWAALKPATISRKNSSIILTDTGALKRSITHEVIKK